MGHTTVRTGAVSYLNARPLTWGFEHGLGAERVQLSFGYPAAIADRMAAGELDLGLLPIVELARTADLELVPGLAVGTYGPSRSVLLVCRRPPREIETVALDPASRTSNALARVLLAQVWGRRPAFVTTDADDGSDPFHGCDAAVRIGDQALFDPSPPRSQAVDLGQLWTEHTRAPFVFAAWLARPGVVDRGLYRLLHASSRQGRANLEAIVEGCPDRDLARRYLQENIRGRLGAVELEAMTRFFRAAAETGAIERVPEVRLALARRTACDEAAEALRR